MRATRTGTKPADFERFAGLSAIVVGVVGFLYSFAFIVLLVAGVAPGAGSFLSSLFLAVSGLLSTAALVAVYGRLRDTDRDFALWAVLLGLAGALGSAIHGGYDLANAINPPVSTPADLPSQIDPRGLLTFGFPGVALVVIAWLIGRGRQFPLGLSYLGYLLGALLVIIYLGRLIVLSPTNPALLVPALLSGFIVNPAWYIWLGLSLWRGYTGQER